MQTNVRFMLAAVGMAVAVAACGPAAFPQPPGTVAVNFTVDDTINKVFGEGDLEWKGGFKITPASADGGTWNRKITKDSTWGGPYAKLYDDGPWSAGGHEPAGATAGDHKWGVTVFATPPATGSDTYEYGAIDSTTGGWLWSAPPPAQPGDNGTFAIAAGATSPVTAIGLTLGAFGTTDLKLVIDTSALGAGSWDTSLIRVKGSAWAWRLVETTAGTGTTHTFLLSSAVGAGHAAPHSGLLKAGDKPEWVFAFGAGDGLQYKDGSGNAIAAGVTAFVGPVGSVTTPVAITLAGNKNTIVTVP